MVRGEVIFNDIDVALIRLKRLSEIIDFSRSSNQIRILLFLGSYGEGTSKDIAGVLGESRKSVLDALRKLRIKGLVEESKFRVDYDRGYYKIYRLSKKGRAVYKSLVNVLYGLSVKNVVVEDFIDINSLNSSLNSLALFDRFFDNFDRFYVLIEIFKILIRYNKLEFNVNWLAKKLGLSSAQLDRFLEPFSNNSRADLKLFELYKRRGERIYKLTHVGLEKLKQIRRIVGVGSSFYFPWRLLIGLSLFSFLIYYLFMVLSVK